MRKELLIAIAVIAVCAAAVAWKWIDATTLRGKVTTETIVRDQTPMFAQPKESRTIVTEWK